MVRRIFAPGLLFKARARRDVYLTSDYRFHSRFAARFEKRNSAIHCTVIGYRNGTVPRRGSGFRNIRYTAGAVKQTVFAVQMKMYKAVHSRHRLSRD